MKDKKEEKTSLQEQILELKKRIAQLEIEIWQLKNKDDNHRWGKPEDWTIT